MSAWIDGKLDLTCSLEILKRALSSLMPQWASHIKVDPNGKLKLYNYVGKERPDGKTCHIIIPGSGRPDTATPPDRQMENDWGFALGKVGKWETVWAEFNAAGASKLSNEARAEVIRLRMVAVAQLKGYSVVKNEKNGDKVHMEMTVSPEMAKMMSELA